MADGDDGRPSYAEVLDALRRPGSPGGEVAEPAPDLSLPGPSLRDVFRAFTPAGTDPDELMAALKGAQLPSVPLSQMGKANEAAAGMRWCKTCERPEPADSACPERFTVPAPPEIGNCAGCGSGLCSCPPAPPADPSPGDLMAGFALADMLKAMTDGGVPLGSAERIIGAMLAAHGIFTAEGLTGG